MAKEFINKNMPFLKNVYAYDQATDNHNLMENKNKYGSDLEVNKSLATAAPPPTPAADGCADEPPSNTDYLDHCHGPAEATGMDKRARRKLIIASILCLIFMIGETVGGALAHSLAIMTDAAHLLTDFASFMISLFAIYIASRPATKRMSFGWHRAEVVGALVSVLMIWVVTAILVYLAVMRISSGKYEIEGKIMLLTSIAGIAINIVMAGSLHQHGHSHGGAAPAPAPAVDKDAEKAAPVANHGHSHGGGDNHAHGRTEKENINVRAAFIHVIGDLVQSIGVFIASLVIYIKPEYKIADPICTFIFSVLVLITTVSILRDTLNVLMEGTPRELDFNEVKSAFYDLPGVVEVHNLRIWSLTVNRTALSVHVAIDPGQEAQSILREASNMLRHRFQISDVTIQLENYVSEMAECQQCQDPID